MPGCANSFKSDLGEPNRILCILSAALSINHSILMNSIRYSFPGQIAEAVTSPE